MLVRDISLRSSKDKYLEGVERAVDAGEVDRHATVEVHGVYIRTGVDEYGRDQCMIIHGSLVKRGSLKRVPPVDFGAGLEERNTEARRSRSCGSFQAVCTETQQGFGGSPRFPAGCLCLCRLRRLRNTVRTREMDSLLAKHREGAFVPASYRCFLLENVQPYLHLARGERPLLDALRIEVVVQQFTTFHIDFLLLISEDLDQELGFVHCVRGKQV